MKQFQKRYPELAQSERVITGARVNGKIYYRPAAGRKASADSMPDGQGRGDGCIARCQPASGSNRRGRRGVRVASANPSVYQTTERPRPDTIRAGFSLA